jgi:hypothetical protein
MTTIFERETCTRCGGCGRYSWCQMHGDTCFKCGGKGKVLTKRGHAAWKWFTAQRSIPASAVVVGQRIRHCTSTITVREITVHTTSSGRSAVNGVWTDHPPRIDLHGTKMVLGVFPTTMVEVLPTTQAELDAQLAAAAAYQATLTKMGKPAKKKA